MECDDSAGGRDVFGVARFRNPQPVAAQRVTVRALDHPVADGDPHSRRQFVVKDPRNASGNAVGTDAPEFVRDEGRRNLPQAEDDAERAKHEHDGDR